MTTYDKKRVAAGFLLAFLVLAAANWHFEFACPRFARFIAALGGRRRILMGKRVLERRQIAAAVLASVGMTLGLGQEVCASDLQAVSDARCVVVGLRMMQMTAPQQQGAGTLLALYYLGRLDGRTPDAEADGLIEGEAEKMTAAEFRADAARCGKGFALRGKEIQKISADLSGKTQGGAAPK